MITLIIMPQLKSYAKTAPTFCIVPLSKFNHL